MPKGFSTHWQRLKVWSKTIAWSRAVSYIVAIAATAYAINDLYGIVDTPAINEIRREVTKKGVVNEQEVRAIVRDEVARILEAEGLVEGDTPAAAPPAGPSPDRVLDSPSVASPEGGATQSGSAPGQQPGPSPGDGEGSSGGGQGGSTPEPTDPPAPQDPPGNEPGGLLEDTVENVDDVIQEVCETLPPGVTLPACP